MFYGQLRRPRVVKSDTESNSSSDLVVALCGGTDEALLVSKERVTVWRREKEKVLSVSFAAHEVVSVRYRPAARQVTATTKMMRTEEKEKRRREEIRQGLRREDEKEQPEEEDDADDARVDQQCFCTLVTSTASKGVQLITLQFADYSACASARFALLKLCGRSAFETLPGDVLRFITRYVDTDSWCALCCSCWSVKGMVYLWTFHKNIVVLVVSK